MTERYFKALKEDYLERQIRATIYNNPGCTFPELKAALDSDLSKARKTNPEVPELSKNELEKLLSSLSGKGLLGTETVTRYVVPSTREIRRTYEDSARLSVELWRHYNVTRG